MEQTVVFSRIRVLVGHPVEVVSKAHLYDRMMESADPSSARHSLPILVKYSRMMKDILAEIQKVVPPSGTPRRVIYPGPFGSPTGMLYEVVGKMALVPTSPAGAEPSHQGGTSQTTSSRRVPNGEGSGAPKGPALPRFTKRAPSRFDPEGSIQVCECRADSEEQRAKISRFVG